MVEPGVESMNDVQRFELWMRCAQRLRVLADIAEKLLILVGCLGVVAGTMLLVSRMYFEGSVVVFNGLIVAVVGALVGAFGQNQASINECNCRVLDQVKRIDEYMPRQ